MFKGKVVSAKYTNFGEQIVGQAYLFEVDENYNHERSNAVRKGKALKPIKPINGGTWGAANNRWRISSLDVKRLGNILNE